MNKVSREKTGKKVGKTTNFFEQCLAQVLELALQFFLLTCDLLRLEFLIRELCAQFFKLIIGRPRWDERG